MATKFYLPSSGAAAITPAIGGTWTSTGLAVVRATSTSKTSTSIAGTAIAVDPSSSTASTLFVQFVSGMLAAQTISGTVLGQMLSSIANVTGATVLTRVAIFVINFQGVVVATLLAGTSGSLALTTTLTNRSTPASVAITSYSCADTDRILIEVGIIRTSGTTARNGSIQFGDNQASDLPVDQTTTGTTNNPYIQFSATLTAFVPTVANNLAALGVG